LHDSCDTCDMLSVQQERLDIEEKYSSLQEEVAGKTKKLKKVWTMYMQAKSEVLHRFFVIILRCFSWLLWRPMQFLTTVSYKIRKLTLLFLACLSATWRSSRLSSVVSVCVHLLRNY